MNDVAEQDGNPIRKLNGHGGLTDVAGDCDNGGASYSMLGNRIASWTTNLLTTATIVIIALVLGSQLVGLWFPNGANREQGEFSIAQSWPDLRASSLEFGESPFQLTRITFEGTETDVNTFLSNRCRHELESNTPPVGIIGNEESDLIAQSAAWSPVENEDRKWRIFSGAGISPEQALPIALGIRDDCHVTDSNGKDELTSRLVVWGLAIPTGAEKWTAYVGQAASMDSTLGLNQLIPQDARRTLAMSDESGGSLIGFSGGDYQLAITYYKNMAKERNWKIEIAQPTSLQNWTASYSTDMNSRITAAQVQLTQDHNGNLTGILMLQAGTRRGPGVR